MKPIVSLRSFNLALTMLMGLGAFVSITPLGAATPVDDLTCTLDCAMFSVELTWTNTDTYSDIEIFRNGMPIAVLPGAATSFFDAPLVLPVQYSVVPNCVGVTAPPSNCDGAPPPVADLDCLRDCGAGTVLLSWTNPALYDTIEIFQDGNPLIALPGVATGFPTNLQPGRTTFEVVASCAGVSSAPVACSFDTQTLPLPSHLILGFEGPGGLVDSVAALEAAHIGLGESFTTIPNLDALPCGTVPGPDTIVWSMTGTFPDNRPITPEHGQFLVDQILAGGGVYHEGNDTWAFDPPTAFNEYDGVGAAANGDDSLIGVSGLGIVTGQSGPYIQDQAGDDSTDQLTTTVADLAGTDSSVLWQEVGTGLGYAVGVYYLTDPGFGKVVCQSFELGGFGGNLEMVVDDIIQGVGIPRCIRVDLLQAIQTTGGPIQITWSASSTFDWTGCTLTVIPPSPNPTEIYSVPMPLWPFPSGGAGGPYVYFPAAQGTYTFKLQPECSGYPGGQPETTLHWVKPYKRGDSNRDGLFDLGDPIDILGGLFGGGGLVGGNPFGCQGAADVNDDGLIDISDPIYALAALFSGGPLPPPPFQDCAPDPSLPALPCDEYDACL